MADDSQMMKDALLLMKVDAQVFNLVRRSCFLNS